MFANFNPPLSKFADHLSTALVHSKKRTRQCVDRTNIERLVFFDIDQHHSNLPLLLPFIPHGLAD
jgi:hypothetical protein